MLTHGMFGKHEGREKFKTYWQAVEPESVRLSDKHCLIEDFKYKKDRRIKEQMQSDCDVVPRRP